MLRIAPQDEVERGLSLTLRMRLSIRLILRSIAKRCVSKDEAAR